MELGHDLRILWAEALGALGHFAGEVQEERIRAAVGCHEGLDRLLGQPGPDLLGGHVHPRASFEPRDLLVGPIEGESRRAAIPRAAERPHGEIAYLLGEAADA